MKCYILHSVHRQRWKTYTLPLRPYCPKSTSPRPPGSAVWWVGHAARRLCPNPWCLGRSLVSSLNIIDLYLITSTWSPIQNSCVYWLIISYLALQTASASSTPTASHSPTPSCSWTCWNRIPVFALSPIGRLIAPVSFLHFSSWRSHGSNPEFICFDLWAYSWDFQILVYNDLLFIPWWIINISEHLFPVKAQSVFGI